MSIVKCVELENMRAPFIVAQNDLVFRNETISSPATFAAQQCKRAGIGRLVLIDPDAVEGKNLNRIANSGKEDAYLGRPKVFVLASAVARMGLAHESVRVSCFLRHPETGRAYLAESPRQAAAPSLLGPQSYLWTRTFPQRVSRRTPLSVRRQIGRILLVPNNRKR